MHGKQDMAFMALAIAEAKKAGRGRRQGIPIGAVLVIDGQVVGRGHNRRVQRASAILHGEMDCLENAGRLKARDYRRATIYTTLSPCPMCSGAIILYGIPRVVVGENVTFKGCEAHLRKRGHEVLVLNDPRCIEMMDRFIRTHPHEWAEDIGVSVEELRQSRAVRNALTLGSTTEPGWRGHRRSRTRSPRAKPS